MFYHHKVITAFLDSSISFFTLKAFPQSDSVLRETMPASHLCQNNNFFTMQTKQRILAICISSTSLTYVWTWAYMAEIIHPFHHIFCDRQNFLDASSHNRVCPSVLPSVGRSVGPSVTLLSKTRQINIFEQNIVRGGVLGPLDASSQLYKTMYRSIGLSVYRSVCHTSVSKNFIKSKLK